MLYYQPTCRFVARFQAPSCLLHHCSPCSASRPLAPCLLRCLPCKQCVTSCCAASSLPSLARRSGQLHCLPTAYTLPPSTGLIVVRTQYDYTPLHWAAHYGRLHVTRLLLEADSDLEAPDLVSSRTRPARTHSLWAQAGDVPLHKAALAGEAEVVTLLLEAESEINQRGYVSYVVCLSSTAPGIAQLWQPCRCMLAAWSIAPCTDWPLNH